MSNFERHIRDYFAERLDITFYTFAYGFAGWRIIGTDFYIEELYLEPNTNYRIGFRFFRELFTFARSRGCTRIVGTNVTNLPAYEEIKKLHTFFGAKYSGQSNGTSEIWIKELL
jgi:hypothetical protein